MAATEIASDGTQIPVYSCAYHFTYSMGNITEMTTVYQGKTYKQTFTYSGADITDISIWELQ